MNTTSGSRFKAKSPLETKLGPAEVKAENMEHYQRGSQTKKTMVSETV